MSESFRRSSSNSNPYSNVSLLHRLFHRTGVRDADSDDDDFEYYIQVQPQHGFEITHQTDDIEADLKLSSSPHDEEKIDTQPTIHRSTINSRNCSTSAQQQLLISAAPPSMPKHIASSSMSQLYSTYHLRETDSDDDSCDNGISSSSSLLRNTRNSRGRVSANSAEAAVASAADNAQTAAAAAALNRRKGSAGRSSIIDRVLGRMSIDPENPEEDVIFDTVANSFDPFVFARQLVAHVFVFLYPCLLENPEAQGFGLHTILPMHCYNWIFPLCAYVMFVSYFATTNTNREILGGAVYMPLILFLQHRTSVALKYAFLSATEYKRFTDSTSLEQGRKYCQQMELINGWMSRNERVFEFELGAAATRVGSKINEIHVVINSPLKSKSDYNQYHYWNAFMLSNELIDTTVDHAKEMVKLADGSFAISVYDLSRAIISRADHYYEMHEFWKEYSLYSYVLVNVAIPFVRIGLYASAVNVDSWLVLFMFTSSVVNVAFGYIVFSILYVAVFDVLRLWNVMWYANELIRTSDAVMTTGAVKKRNKEKHNSSGKFSKLKFLSTASDQLFAANKKREKEDLKSRQILLQRAKSKRASMSIMTISRENRKNYNSPSKLLIKHASLKDVSKYMNFNHTDDDAAADADTANVADAETESKDDRAVTVKVSDWTSAEKKSSNEVAYSVYGADQECSFSWSNPQSVKHGIEHPIESPQHLPPLSPLGVETIIPMQLSSKGLGHDRRNLPQVPVLGGTGSGAAAASAVRATGENHRVSWLPLESVNEEKSVYSAAPGTDHGTFAAAKAIATDSSICKQDSSVQEDELVADENGRKRTDSVVEIGENVAENGAPALLPRVPIASTVNHQNIIAWTYTRLILQHFGLRFRWRIDFNVAVTIGLMMVLMVYALVLIFTAKDQRSQFLTSYFLQSLLAISLSMAYIWAIVCIGSLINRTMRFHSQSLAYYQSRVNRRMLLCEYLSELEAEYVPLKSLRKFIGYAMDIIEASNIANPFRILGMDAEPSLSATVITTAISFYGLILSMYLNAETSTSTTGRVE